MRATQSKDDPQGLQIEDRLRDNRELRLICAQRGVSVELSREPKMTLTLKALHPVSRLPLPAHLLPPPQAS